MSASLLSGGSAPSFVPSGVSTVVIPATTPGSAAVQPAIATGVAQSSTSIQCLSGVLPPTGDPNHANLALGVSATELIMTQPIFASSVAGGGAGVPGVVTSNLPQSSFVWTVPNASSDAGPPEGALTLYSYLNGAFNNALVVVPKPILTAGAGDDIFQLTGGSQSGQALFNPVGTQPGNGNTTVVVPNTLIGANCPVFLQPAGAADATATSFIVTIQAGVSFTITANAAATANKLVNWFIPHY